jgi:hypothetical protein
MLAADGLFKVGLGKRPRAAGESSRSRFQPINKTGGFDQKDSLTGSYAKV